MLCEHLVVCHRLDRVKIPYVGTILQQFGFSGKFPKVHRGFVYYGDTEASYLSEKWTYFGKRFYRAYNTKQKFRSDYPHGVFSQLSPWHLKGRYLPAPLTLRQKFDQFLLARPSPPARYALKPKHPLIDKVMRLPDPHQRMEFMQRFQACGAFDAPLERLSRSARRELAGLV